MNPNLSKLQPYPFERLNALKSGITPPADLAPIALSIGEPKHPAPGFARETLSHNLHHLSGYPSTKGIPELRQAIAHWAERRFKLTQGLCPETQVLPCTGTREALFAITQAIIDRSQSSPLVVCPNPFYQIYEGAARESIFPRFRSGARRYLAALPATVHLLTRQSHRGCNRP